MKLLLFILAKIFNALPKTDKVLLHWCHIYGKYGLEAPNLVGMTSAPTVSTDATPSSITTTSAVFDTNSISNTGGANASARGICWVSGAGGTPTTADSKTTESGSFGTGNFSATATGLTQGTTYSVRAYATNSAGTGYGSTVEVTTTSNTPPTVTADTETGASTATYYFDGSDVAATDINGFWTNVTNADDGNTGTTANFSSASADNLVVEGTNAPSSGDAISSIRVRAYGIRSGTCDVTIRTDGAGETLGTAIIPTSTGWGNYVNLTVPSGGWTWAKVQALEFVAAAFVFTTVSLARVELEVTTSTTTDTTPDLTFTGTDPQSDDIRYNVQVDTVNTFDSGSTIDKVSGTDSGFSGSPDNTDPFTSGQAVTYTVQEVPPTLKDSQTVTTVNNFNITGGSGASAEAAAQSFTASSSYSLGEIDVNISKSGSPTDNLYIEITTTINGTPIATSGDVNGVNISTSQGYVTFTFATPVSITSSTRYFIRLRRDGSTDTSNYYKWYHDNGANSLPSETSYKLEVGTWYEYSSTRDFAFKTYVSAYSPLTIGTYYWRVRGLDPSGSNTYGSWSSTRSFEITSAGATLVPQDISHSLTLDNTTIAQNHILVPADISHSLTLDNTTISQNHVLIPSDISHGLTIDSTIIDITYTLSTQDIQHGLTLDTTTITQNHIFTPDDIAFGFTTDNGGIIQNHILVTQDIELGSSIDATTINQNHVTTVADIEHSLTLDNTTINQNHVIVAQDIEHGSSIDATTINQNHIIDGADIEHSFTVDTTTVTEESQNYTIITQDVELGLALDPTTISQNHIFTPDDIAFGFTADGTDVTETNFNLIIQDISHSLIVDTTSITQDHVLSPQDISHSITLDNTTIDQSHIIASADIEHTLTLDSTSITQNHILPVDDIAFGFTADNGDIIQNHVLVTQDIELGLTEDNVSLAINVDITPQDVSLTPTLDNTTIEETTALIVQDISFSLTEDTTNVDTGKRYWIGGTGSWSDTAHWAYMSGGSGGATVPTSSNDVYFDANSFSGNGQTVTLTATTYAKNFDWTGVTENVTFEQNGNNLDIDGSFILCPTLTWANTSYHSIYFSGAGTGTNYINSFGIDLHADIRFYNGSGSIYELQSDLVSTYAPNFAQITFNDYGTLTTNNYDITTYTVDAWKTTFNLGSSTISVVDDILLYTPITINPNTATFKSLPYVASPQVYIDSGITNIYKYHNANTLDEVFINISSASFDTIQLDPNTTSLFASDSNITADNWIISGTAGNPVIISEWFGQYYFNKPSGTVTADYVEVDNTIVGGGASWYAGTGFVDNGNNNGWIFTLITQDIELGLTEDNTTVVEDAINHEIITQDIELGLTVDATTITQNHIIPVDDIAFSITEDSTDIGQNHILSTNDISLSLTTDNTTLIENYILTTQDVSHSFTLDTTTLTQNHILPTQDIQHSITVDSIVLTEVHLISAGDLTLGVTLDGTTIDQVHILTPDDIEHAIQLDNVVIEEKDVELNPDLVTFGRRPRKYWIDTEGNLYWVISQDTGVIMKVN